MSSPLYLKSKTSSSVQWVGRVRAATAAIILVGVAAFHAGRTSAVDIFPVLFLCIAEIFLNQPYPYLLRYCSDKRWLLWSQAFDVVAVTLIIRCIGATAISPLIMLYPLIYISTAFVAGFGQSFLMANLCAAAYAFTICGRVPVWPAAGDIVLVACLNNIMAACFAFLGKDFRAKEADFKKSKDLFEEVSSHSKEWLWETNARGEYVFCSRSVMMILGYDASEFIGKSFSEKVPVSEQAIVQEFFDQFLTNRQPFQFLSCLFTAVNGEELFIESNAVPLFDKDVFRGFRGISRDVTERRRSWEVTRQAKERAEQMMRIVPCAVFTVDKEGRVTTWNRKAEEITGYSDQEAIGQECSFFAVPSGDHVSGVPSDSVSNPVIGRESQIRTKDGQIKVVLKSSDHLHDATGSIIGGIESFEDITERKDGELQLEKYRYRLEEMIVERTMELRRANEQLKIEKEKAEESNRLKSQFIFNVSHEMRTPLNGIIGFVEAIAQTHEMERVRHLSATALKEAEILLALISDVLDQAKIEAGRLELLSEPVSLAEVVAAVQRTVQVPAGKKGLRLEAAIGTDVPPCVMADRLRLFQILLNFVNNAVKFTAQGSVTIRLEAQPTGEDWVWVKFRVIDTGIGIPADRQHLIFERFAQVDGATTRKYGGTGLGTAIARGLAVLMGGQVGFSSEPGKGSEFWFVVPFLPCTPEPAAMDKAVEADMLMPVPGNAARILTVDDYQTNQDVVRMHLESCGYTVEPALNGIEALKKCETGAFSLILMDIQMPEMDGFEATRQLRARGGLLASVPILGLTANADALTIRQCLDAGMNGVMTKPIRRASFLAEVRKWLAPPDQGLAMPAPEIAAPPVPDEVAVFVPPMQYDEAIREFAGNKGLLDNVVKSFLLQAERQMGLMRSALTAGDWAALGKEAHKVRGAAANLTAAPLSEAARIVEEHAKAGNVAGMDVLIHDVFAEFERFKTFVAKGYKQ